MSHVIRLLENNAAWAAQMVARDPHFFERLRGQQSPEYLWIGCSDSRVPANEIVGLAPGELFVHRNVANVVFHNDLNCVSVLQYAVDVLHVKHVIVTGHYGCGGVRAVFDETPLGTIVVREAWARGSELAVHDWVYGLHDGLLHDLGFAAKQADEVEPAYRHAVATKTFSDQRSNCAGSIPPG
jgi:carbonic anhydrase